MPNQPSDLLSFMPIADKGDFVVLDTEATSLTNEAEICELAIIDEQGNQLFNELIKPTKPISLDASKVNGITDRMVEQKFTWSAHREKVLSIIAGKNVVAYNATFDRRLFHQSDRANGIDQFDYSGFSPWYDLMTAFAERYGDFDEYRGQYRWKKLVKARDFYHCQERDLHNAMSDAQMTLDVVQAMVSEWRSTYEPFPMLDADQFAGWLKEQREGDIVKARRI